MKERQRWKSEEDAILRAYVKQFGPREWHLVSLRMNTPLDRDAKSCLERWKNYLKPGIKKGSLTEEEQRLVIRLQAKHGNKWKKIASEVPGRTAKRLGKWWEVFREKQQREKKKERHRGGVDPMEEGKYDEILESLAEKVVSKDQHSAAPPFLMATCNNNGVGFHHSSSSDPPPPPNSNPLPPWLSNSSPSVTLTLSPSTAVAPLWLQQPLERREPENVMCEVGEWCRELEEGHRAWAAHKKEAGWRVRRMEVQLEAEKASRRKEKMEEFEMKMKALREEEMASLERIEADYREQLGVLRRDADAKEQKLIEQLIANHTRLPHFLQQHLGGCKTTTRHV